MHTIVRTIDGHYIEHTEAFGAPPGWIIHPAPPGPGNWKLGPGGWEATEEPRPTPAGSYDPRRVSKIDFRRLLTAEEAARVRLLEAAPRVTALELAQAFDPETPTPDLQIRVAVEDALQQFALLPEFVELAHPDTAEFIQVLALAGVVAPERVPVILAGLPPTP